ICSSLSYVYCSPLGIVRLTERTLSGVIFSEEYDIAKYTIKAIGIQKITPRTACGLFRLLLVNCIILLDAPMYFNIFTSIRK
ncbi:MAG TPA: hypothetical protein DD733_09365, partial [Clostridiales bacterium]|nr:hypothetical protein [Clostridiales bacterium]